MDNKRLLGRLFELEDQYEVATPERKLELDKKIREIGAKLFNNPKKKPTVRKLLDKGADMTFSDVKKLRDLEVTKLEIFVAMGIPRAKIPRIDLTSAEQFYKSIEEIKTSKHPKKLKKSEVDRMAKLIMTVDEFVDLNYKKKLSIAKIAERKGVSAGSVYYWIKIRKEEIDNKIIDIKSVKSVDNMLEIFTKAPVKAQPIEEPVPTVPLDQFKELQHKYQTELIEKKELERNYKLLEEKLEKQEADCKCKNVKPNYYHKGGLDVIGFAKTKVSKEELRGFLRINILKYVIRYHEKGGVEDLHKSSYYTERLIELESSVHE